ncbi:MAG: DNA topoisomerase VI [Myxococcales bacterium]|nr:DNA topoisomerase VI [Myxococcales bacterium]|tara:strand:+ start:160 stop:1296 length:1137 start_codon:yes stop_codon:yes gene_type:complete
MAGKKRSKAQEKKDKATNKAIDGVATMIYNSIQKNKKPDLSLPVRSLSNVKYDQRKGYFEIGKSTKVRTLTVNTVKTFAQSLKMMALSKELITQNDFATKRDAYYQSKNWQEAKFDEQVESDTVMDDIEALFASQNLTREELRFVPQEHGGAVAGDLVVIDQDLDTGKTIEIDCTKFGSGAYSVPSWVEHLQFKTKAKFILAIETHGMFQRLQSHNFWRKSKSILVSMSGVPSRACRRFIRRLSEECKLPVYAFTDCDPYGISNIYRTLKVGSGNAAHINRFFCVPNAKFLGMTPQDIIDWKLKDATHKLSDIDIKRAKDALKNDPFFQSHKPWSKALEQMIKMGVRAEQQALSKHGLNFVIEEYLPKKLKNTKLFLP